MKAPEAAANTTRTSSQFEMGSDMFVLYKEWPTESAEIRFSFSARPANPENRSRPIKSGKLKFVQKHCR